MLLTSGRVFCILWNTKSFILKRDINCAIERTSGHTLYKAYDSSGSFRYFNREKRGFLLYSFGFEKRNKDFSDVYFLESIGLTDNDLVVDCGANFGDLYFAIKQMNIDVNYLGFEPSPSEFQCLQYNVTQGSLNQVALWFEEDKLDFYVNSDFADSSLIEPSKYHEKITVDCKRLDSIIDSNTQIKLLKLEAEGAEPEILLGCSTILANIHFISADLGFERGVREESTLPDVCNFLISNGFRLLGVKKDRLTALFVNSHFQSEILKK